jgi:L-lysine 2,3-aminomutase
VRARELMAALAARLPGYLLPRLARELPGAAAKTVLAASASTDTDTSTIAWDRLHSAHRHG